MAVTQNSYTGNGSTTTYSFTFPYLKLSEIKASLNSVVTTAFTTPTATTIQFNTAPSSGDKIRIYRETGSDSLAATFYAGSAIKSEDLNDNFTQNLYAVQEVTDRYVSKLGGSVMTGDLLLGEDVKVIFEGATDNAHETTLTIADPTADRTITLPNVTGTVVTTGDTGSIVTAMIAPDAINGTKIANDSIDSEHYVDGSIDTAHIANLQIVTGKIADLNITTGKLADLNVTTGKIANLAVTTGKIAADAVDGTKIADDSIDSEHYVDGSIDSAHIATDAVGATELANNSVASANIIDGSIVNADINASADIAGSKLLNDSVSLDKLGAGALPTDITVASANIVNGTIVDADIATGTLDNRYFTETELTGGALDGRYYTETESDARYFNISTGDTIKDGDAFPDNDTTIATTAAINDRIIDLVDDVGGFVPIANETSFPNANPDVNNGAGTLVSIKALASNLTSNGSGVATIANGTVGNSTVTITGLANSTTYAATFGMIVETTTTLNTYTFHRQVPKATEVTTVAGNVTNVNTVAGSIANVNTVATNIANVNTVASNNSNVTAVGGSISNVNTVATNLTNVNNFADLYQIASSAPSTDGGGNALAVGDLWFDSSSNKVLKVHDGTAFKNTSPTQAVLDDISIVSGSLTRQEDLGSIADAISSGSSTGALDTCATNITNVNTFANVYRIAASAPSSSLDEGDLWYDSTANVLKYYNGTIWTVTAAAGLSNVSEDTTPELGGNLDCNNRNLTEVGTVSGNNLQIDFGTLT